MFKPISIIAAGLFLLSLSACQSLSQSSVICVDCVRVSAQQTAPNLNAYFPLPKAGFFKEHSYLPDAVTYFNPDDFNCTGANKVVINDLTIRTVQGNRLNYTFMNTAKQINSADLWKDIMSRLVTAFLEINQLSVAPAQWHWRPGTTQMIDVKPYGPISVTPIDVLVPIGNSQLIGHFIASREHGLIRFEMNYPLNVSQPQLCDVIMKSSSLYPGHDDQGDGFPDIVFPISRK